MYELTNDHSSPNTWGMLASQLLVHLRTADILTKISIFFVIALGACLLTLISTKPIKQVGIRQKYFTSNVAHELNTPLSIQKTTAEVILMKKQELSAAEASAFASSVIEEVDRMSEIVKYFLHFASPEKKMQLNMDAVNITSVISKVTRTLLWLATQCEVTIEAPKEDEEIVWGNFTALEEMITSLVKNAIIHAPSGSVVKISLKDLGSSVRFGVFNEGPGIAPADLPYIFDAFYKGEDAMHFGRLGLGLTIAREIAKMHSTDIEVRSSETSGTEFFVKIPK